MKNLILKSIAFIRENPSIIYSLVLVVIIPAAFFINTYTTTNDFEKNIDKITQINAVTAENIIKLIAKEKLDDPEYLGKMVEEIRKENRNIFGITILRPEEEAYEIVASTDPASIGQISHNIQEVLAWQQPEGIAFLSQNEQGRFWRVTKSFTDAENNKAGLISINFSLLESDKLIDSTISRAYFILIITILVVILFVSNQARLFGYALTLSKLKEIDQMKDTFISMASHELRSPLTAIKGYLEFLNEKPSADEESKHYLSNITISVDRLGTLVNDILEVSRLEGNRLPIEITSFDPTPIISQSIEELRSQAILKNLALNCEPIAPATISADPERLKQILVNLVGNAIKYTQKGSVTVSTKIKDNSYLITIADTGIGMSSEDRAKLFEKFYRIKNDQTKDIVGTGLGLWITGELTQKMNGKITVESIEGVGSHFTLHLPLA